MCNGRRSSAGLIAMSALVPLLAAPSLLLTGSVPAVRPSITRPRVGAAPPTASLASYAAEAADLFGNMQGTAALVAGGLVPLASFAGPKPEASDSVKTKRIKRLHLFIACASLVSELLAIVYATISKNLLVEAVVPRTHSLKALLLEGEYALPWIGCNAHFLLGLFGFVCTVALNAWLAFGCVSAGLGACIGPALTCGAGSALLLMLSVVNSAVAKADANAVRAGGSMLALLVRYASLLVREVVVGRKLLVGLALGLGAASVVFGVRAIRDS